MEQAKRIFYQKLRDFIYHIPGENPSPFTLCGTNCYIVGSGKTRIMIEAGDYPERNQKFLENFTQFMNDFSSVSIDRIFITHAHVDHFGGLYDILKLLQEKGHEEPQIFKMLDGNRFEKEVFERFPTLAGKVHDMKHNDLFQVEDFQMRALHTPGHATDHISFLMNSPKHDQVYLFSGDIILGGPSTSVQDLTSYMQSLYGLRKEDFSHICLPHSIELVPEQIIVEGKPKLEAYIAYREERDRAIMNCFHDQKVLTREDLYKLIYGARELTGGLQMAAYINLELHLEKLEKEGLLVKSQANDTYQRPKL